MQQSKPARRPKLLAVVALSYVVCAAYWPILGFEFADYDTSEQLVDNPYIRGLTAENVKHIFTSRCLTSYYPIRTLTYAMDYQCWGLDPMGFKLTNGLIHLANVLLVFWLILRLFRRSCEKGDGTHFAERPTGCFAKMRSVPFFPWWDAAVAAFSAAVFAIHPVVVEPVAWVPGREELLMTLGALGCIHFLLAARRLGERGGQTGWVAASRAGAALCCAAACLSNAVGAVIPLLAVVVEAFTSAKPNWRSILYGTLPLWAISAATIVSKRLAPEGELVEGLISSWAQRPMLSLTSYWLNLKTLFWPLNLAIACSVPTPTSWLDRGVVLGAVSLSLTCFVLWRLRRRKMVLLGLVWFGVALAPSLQILLHHCPRADRYLYLPLPGIAVAVAMGLRPLKAALKTRSAVAAVVVAGLAGLELLNIRTADQLQTWRDNYSVWENSLRVDPECATAHRAFATELASRPQASREQYEQAIRHYSAAMRLEPANTETMRKFAWLLGTCPIKELRDDKLAVQLATRACQLTSHADPIYWAVLAEIHAQAGRFEMAVETTEKAVAAARTVGDLESLSELRATLESYKRQNAPPTKQSGAARN